MTMLIYVDTNKQFCRGCPAHPSLATAKGRQVINRRLAKRDQLSRQFSLAYWATRSALLGPLSGR
jgi:hypothetical protein